MAACAHQTPLTMYQILRLPETSLVQPAKDLMAMKVAELKEELEARGEGKTGNKACRRTEPRSGASSRRVI